MWKADCKSALHFGCGTAALRLVCLNLWRPARGVHAALLVIPLLEFPGWDADKLVVAAPVKRVTLRKDADRDKPQASRQFNFFRGRNIEDRHDWVIEFARFRLPKRLIRKTKDKLG